MPAEPTPFDPALQDLLHRVADGSADPAEQAAFQKALAGSPGLRTEFEAIRRVVAGLDALPREEAPPGLKDAVLQELHRRRTTPAPARTSARRWRFLGLAAGLLLVAGSIAYQQRARWAGSLDAADAAATMGAHRRPAEPPALTLRRVGRDITVEVAPVLPGRAMSLSWDPAVLACVGTTPPQPGVAAAERAGRLPLGDPRGRTLLIHLRIRTELSQPSEVLLWMDGEAYLRSTLPEK
jgi:anti-sigma factor RsiW